MNWIELLNNFLLTVYRIDQIFELFSSRVLLDTTRNRLNNSNSINILLILYYILLILYSFNIDIL